LCEVGALRGRADRLALFMLSSRQSDSTAFLLFLDTYATRLLAQALNGVQYRYSASHQPKAIRRIQKPLTVEGKLLTHTEGFWYVFQNGALIPIPDDKFERVQITPSSEMQTHR
jgi:hypothetical protein